MSIKVADLAYCRLQVPDLDKAEQFLTDFGLIRTSTEAHRRFFRPTDPTPYCYIVEEGPAHFLGFAFHARSRADLDLLAKTHGKQVEEVTPVKRLAHVVLGTPRVRETTAWFHSTLGTISSDEVVAGPEKSPVGSFIRIDSGEDYVDHHTIFIIRNARSGLHHLSFESQDFDAVLADHYRLKNLGRYEHIWGIGRHLLGSQIFDYWTDPFGYPHEHWADSDRVNSTARTNIWDAREGMVTQWGDEAPERFRNGVRP